MGISITKEVYRYLANHAWDLQDKKISIVNVFATDFNAYMEILDFLNRYIERIDNYLDTVKTQIGPNRLPFVILESVAHVKMSDGKMRRFRVVLPGRKPQKEKPSADTEDVICFSPTGHSLLFKEAGEDVTVGDGEKKKAGVIESIDFDLML